MKCPPGSRHCWLSLLWALILLGMIAAPWGARGATPTLLQADAGRPIAREERLRLFDQVWRAIYDHYYARAFGGVDWRIQRELYRPKAAEATTREELYRVLRRLVATLSESHTRVFAPEEAFDRQRPTRLTVGLLLRQVEGAIIVVEVDPDSEAARAGIRPGFRLESVDGQPVVARIEAIREELSAPSKVPAEVLNAAILDRLFWGPVGVGVEADFTDARGERVRATLTRRRQELSRRVTSRQLPHGMGYLEVTSFRPEIESEVAAALATQAGARGLILDLRRNGGGLVATVSRLAGHFLPAGTALGEFITRQGRTVEAVAESRAEQYRGPLVVLISDRSASGAEVLAAALQESRRAYLIGAHPTTCGCLLGVGRTILLSDGGKLNISDTDFRTARGQRIEGRGLQPDRSVPLRLDDLAQDRDRPLEEAIAYLARTLLLGPNPPSLDFPLLTLPSRHSPSRP